METVFIEAQHADRQGNHGKFMIGRFTDEEWARRSKVEPALGSLLGARGHARHHLLVVDLETCEGAVFSPGGLADADLRKHRVWVCPLFPHFLAWLYKQDLTDLSRLPRVVDFSYEEAPFALYRERQAGEQQDEPATEPSPVSYCESCGAQACPTCGSCPK